MLSDDFVSIAEFALVAEPYSILTACYTCTINPLDIEDQTTIVTKVCNFFATKGYKHGR